MMKTAFVSKNSFVGYVAMALFAAFLFAPAAWAQQAAPPPPAQEQIDVEVNDDELDAVARAYIDVQNLLAEYQAKFGQIQDPDKAKEIQQQLSADANALIEERGLELQRFDLVIQAANVDEGLRDRLTERIEELVESGDV